MTTASARAVPAVFVRSTMMAAASAAVLAAFAPQVAAAPNCSGDGTANTCVIDLTNVATENVDAAGQGASESDVVQFVGPAPLAVNANIFSNVASTTARLLNFELAQVMNGADLTVTGLTADNTYSQNWQIDAGGIMRALGGNAIGDGALVTVNGLLEIGGGSLDETIGSLSGSGAVSLLNGRVLHTGGLGVATPFSGVISGSGGLDKVGASVLRLTGDNSYTGATTVSAGILEIGHAGAIDNSTAVTINTNAQLTGTTAYTINAPVTNSGRLTGNVTVNGTVTNAGGGILPGNTADSGGLPNPGQAMGIVTINGNYIASGTVPLVGMFVDLDAALPANGTAGTTHDFLDINGNVSGVPTTLFVVEFDEGVDTGVATTGNGIQLFRVSGTTTPGAFVQGNALNAGAYQYLLTYVADYDGGTADGYFLQSAVRDEMVAHPALLSASQSVVRGCFRDDQRVPDSPKNATFGRAWFGYHQGATEFGADTGIEMDLDYSCSTGGMDWRMGYGWFGGIAGGFGSANGDLVAPAGVGSLDGDARAIEVYAAFTSSSFFVNLSAGYADMDWTYAGAISPLQQTSVTGFIASAQAGLALDLNLVAFKLIGSINYDDTNCGEDCFGFAVTEDTGLIEGKATARFDGVTWGGSIRPWAAISYSDVLSDGVNTVSLGAVSVSSATNDELVSLDAGLQTYLDENFALFLDGGYHESLSRDINGYKGGVGLKLYW